MEETTLIFFVNGKKVVESKPDPEVTLLHYLRKKLRLTGSKLGCGEGGCGACTVMVSRSHTLLSMKHPVSARWEMTYISPMAKENNDFKPQFETESIVGNTCNYSVNACLAPVCSLHGLAVTTVEGIGSTKTRLHPVQEVLAKSHGSQCGFCTPGIVMSMYTLLRNIPQPTQQQVEDNFDGNLCRCTGYRPILQGFSSFTKNVCGLEDNCCRAKSPSKDRAETGVPNEDCCKEESWTGICYDPSQEPIFPPELKTKCSVYETSLMFSTDRVTWYRPVSLETLLALKSSHPTAKIVIGNTEVGIETKFKNMQYPITISATHVPELNQHTTTDTGITVGSSVTLSSLNQILQQTVDTLPEHKTRVYRAMREMLKWFAGHQIRNVASVGGNIMTASPISDLNPLLMAAGATLTVQAKGKPRRQLPMDGEFFRGYRKTTILPDEVLLTIHIPFTAQNEYFTGFKQANRKDDDISIVNAGMRVRFCDGTDVVDDVTMAYGGMAPTTVLAKNTMAGIKGEKWNDELLTKVCRLLESDLPLAPGSPGGQVEYRRTLTTSFFFKFYIEVTQNLKKISTTNEDAIGDIFRATSEGVQVFQEVPADQCPDDAVGRPLVHTSALQQTTGEALYIDDLPMIEGELYAAVVQSSKAHATIVSIDASEALRMSGVVDFVTYKDIPGVTTFATVPNDEQQIFASKEVVYNGQIVGCILGKTKTEAQRAAKAVRIEYEEKKAILTIKEAIGAKSFLVPEKCVENGDLDLGLAESDHVIEGEIHIGSQEHFYLETHAAAARPTNEDGGMEIISNTQFPSGLQHFVAETLAVTANRIVSRCKRIGGAFGGKETNTCLIALPVAVCAAKVNCPVRCMLDRDEDISISGTRHAFLARYKVGFMKTGHIKAMDINLYSNGGCSLDLSKAVMIRAMHSSENAYNIPNFRVRGTVCRTNLPSATAFRGFGSPQAMFATETIVDAISEVIDRSQCDIRQLNLYHEGDVTFYGQEVREANIRKLWDQCFDQSDFAKRQKQVEDFNRQHRWKKRGISIIPTKYPLSYPRVANFLNQACALVTLYQDGSVLVAQCGTEMGQGLYTKMIQIASRALGVSSSSIYINDTCTDKIPLTAPTAASVGSDTNGAAVQVACEKLRRRLEPFRKRNPTGSFRDWVQAAYFDRVHLSATGYHRTEGLDYDPVTKRGRMFNYFTCGVACSEVEIDCLTGDHQVLRTDIVMDVGKSLNPAIDIGQIEGAFVQGYGLLVLEQHKISPSGFIMTRGPGTYKIPGFKNIPVKLNVTLLKDSANSRAVYSSKGIGEPPLFLASSIFFAIKNAIRSARRDAGHGTEFRLDSPATPEKIRMACQDQFTKQFPVAQEGTYMPWYVKL